MPEKYAYRVGILFFVKRKKTHAEIRLRIYAWSVKGNIKQTKESKNFIRIVYAYFLYAYPYFFAHMRKNGLSVKAALLVQNAHTH